MDSTRLNFFTMPLSHSHVPFQEDAEKVKERVPSRGQGPQPHVTAVSQYDLPLMNNHDVFAWLKMMMYGHGWHDIHHCHCHVHWYGSVYKSLLE